MSNLSQQEVPYYPQLEPYNNKHIDQELINKNYVDNKDIVKDVEKISVKNVNDLLKEKEKERNMNLNYHKFDFNKLDAYEVNPQNFLELSKDFKDSYVYVNFNKT